MAGEPQADCLFCKIVSGDVPATVVRETETVVAFRDINPQAPTHILVIPRVHHPDAASLAAAEPGIAADLLREAGEIAAAEKIDGSGYRIVFNTGSGAGQTVFHAHAHLLGGRGLQWPPG
ncbi:histidine triad nucleotide-binding protein [Streptomyces melanogenes]|uniref:Histidine triad nucleotide-binding protein n=1 Tax=Streptomyces melanogenes TaxID=67326 RepID=A0ABZ1XJW4_9ACTN|nr:histidine triad nucleotide-binding protein [Streptomyces melanogenes]